MIIAQITDLHVGRPIEVEGTMVDPRCCLERAVAHLNGLTPPPDIVLVTGDLTRDESPEDYAQVKAALAGLAMPVYVIPGNHDDRANLRAAFGDAGYLPREGEFLHYVLEDYPLRVIALDTHVPGREGGELCAARLAWLQARLAEAPQRPTLICMHHPPFTTGIPFFDGMGCARGEAMGEIVARHPRVEAVLCGHVHRAIDLKWNGTVVRVTPSTAYQYALQLFESDDIEALREPAACRICLWKPEVGLVSHLSYIEG
jgi:3',5'-cyclic AMP phosphodiesterase CpdA